MNRKEEKIMKIALIIIIALIVISLIAITIQNRKPQVELGLVNNKFHELSSKPNGVSTQTKQEDKRIEALEFKESLAASKDAIKKAFEAYGSIEIKEEQDNYIYAVATTGTMKYHDDIEIYFDKSSNKVHYRSASRAGYSDNGLNRKRFDSIAKVYSDQ